MTQPNEPRDYLAEAHRIIRGETMMLPQVEHLKALLAQNSKSREALLFLDAWYWPPQVGYSERFTEVIDKVHSAITDSAPDWKS